MKSKQKNSVMKKNSVQLTVFFLLLPVLFLFLAPVDLYSCTSVIVSGKYTVNGRPLIWKNRDTGALNNKVVYFNSGKYTFIGVVNSKDSLNKSVWMGMNSAGFAIVNTVSYNLNLADTGIKQSGHEGWLMKTALANCGSLEDFEHLLDTMSKPTHMTTNLGAIDANGGAAYYELGFFGYTKLDANDPKVAPHGYIVHTNYSFTGDMGIGAGYIRYTTIDRQFRDAMLQHRMSAQYILQEGSRCLKHALTGTDLSVPDDGNPEDVKMVWFEDFIPRKSTASAVVVEGVKPGESPALTTMWTVLGFPLTSVVVPVWLTPGGKLPSLLTYDKNLKDAPFCNMALQLKERCYPVKWGSSAKKYINIHALVNRDHTGILQVIRPVEDRIFSHTETQLNAWRKRGGLKEKEVIEHYQWVEQQIRTLYHDQFGL
jgi:hypothetical protein